MTLSGPITRISLELTNACTKGCWFCYNLSTPAGSTRWSPQDVIRFAQNCAEHGVQALSLGGGEPLQYPGLFAILEALQGVLFRSFTTHGLSLAQNIEKIIQYKPDKIHISIHFPERDHEVSRVRDQVLTLEGAGIRAGVNLLVARSRLEDAKRATEVLHKAGIFNERIVFLPMRGRDTPSPSELAEVAGGVRFQSMTCLLRCAASPRFASVGWDKTVAWCSYTTARAPLESLTFEGLRSALDGLGLRFCGGMPEDQAG